MSRTITGRIEQCVACHEYWDNMQGKDGVCPGCQLRETVRCAHCASVLLKARSRVAGFQRETCADGHEHGLCFECRQTLGDLCPDSDEVTTAKILRGTP